MDTGNVKVVCDATAQLMPHLIEYGGQSPKDRKPEDDALVRQLRIAIGALAAAVDNVARLTPPPIRPPVPPSPHVGTPS